MINNKQQLKKRHSLKKTSEIAKSKSVKFRSRASLAKSIGKLHRVQEENPLIAIQKVNLFRKQKHFLSDQAVIFEKKAKILKNQVKELDEKIKVQKEAALNLVKNLEVDQVEMEEVGLRSRPGKTVGQQVKKFFKLGY